MELYPAHSGTDSLSGRLGFRGEGSVHGEGCGRRKSGFGQPPAVCGVARATGPLGPAWARLGPPRAALLLAGPRTRQVRQPPGRRQGANYPLARLGGDRLRARRRERRLQGLRGERIPRQAPRVATRSADRRLPPTSQPAEDRLQRQAGRRSAEHQQGAGQAVRISLGAAGGQCLRQQRSGRDHARPLHGAGVARKRQPTTRVAPPASTKPRRTAIRHRASSIRRPVRTTRT